MNCEEKLYAIESVIRDWYADKTTTKERALIKIDKIILEKGG